MDLKDLEDPVDEEDSWLTKEGKRALKYSNEFRAGHALPACNWNQELCNIAKEHCDAMAAGQVPIGHDGFDKRFKKVTFYIKSMSENVAWSQGA